MSTTTMEPAPATDADLAAGRQALTKLIANGDLDRLVELARLIGSAQDALSDDIVSRVAGMTADSLVLLDRALRNNTLARLLQVLERLQETGVLDSLINALSTLVTNGDLDRLVELARLIGAAQDALSDDIVTRVADVASDVLVLVDRATRRGAFTRLLDMTERVEQAQLLELAERMAKTRAIDLVERLEQSGLAEDILESVESARADMAKMPPARGGLAGLWSLIKQPETQQNLQFAMRIISHLRERRAAARG